jgi:hypothetical protein
VFTPLQTPRSATEKISQEKRSGIEVNLGYLNRKFPDPESPEYNLVEIDRVSVLARPSGPTASSHYGKWQSQIKLQEGFFEEQSSSGHKGVVDLIYLQPPASNWHYK